MTHPFFDEEPHLIAVENAVKTATLETIERCADRCQMWQPNESIDADSRQVSLIKIAISDFVREMGR